MNKIKTLPELVKIVDGLKKQGKKIVTTNGCFDIIHLGHTTYLKQAKEMGDILVIGLNSDASVKRLKGEKRPINNEQVRAENLSKLKYVDYIVIFNENDPCKLLAAIKPDIHVKGGDYKPEELIEKNIVEKNNGKIVLVPEVEGYSTTKIIEEMGSSNKGQN